jgi:hypothetical protein
MVLRSSQMLREIMFLSAYLRRYINKSLSTISHIHTIRSRGHEQIKHRKSFRNRLFTDEEHKHIVTLSPLNVADHGILISVGELLQRSEPVGSIRYSGNTLDFPINDNPFRKCSACGFYHRLPLKQVLADIYL